jgi:hypothetical protein
MARGRRYGDSTQVSERGVVRRIPGDHGRLMESLLAGATPNAALQAAAEAYHIELASG